MKWSSLLIALLVFVSAPVVQAKSAWPFWDRYAAHFVSAEGRVIDFDRGSMTTSEGQAYALFFALVAKDAPTFERIRHWTETNLAQGSLSQTLPAWSWGRGSDGTWGILDRNSASDADLWIAYTLIEAGELWQRPEYSKSGKALLETIARKEVSALPQLGPALLPGAQGFHPEEGSWILNPSYLPLPLMTALGRVAPDGPWKQMAAALPGLLRQASPSGFAMDWVKFVQGGAFSPVTEPAGTAGSPCGSYDAIRVYLWAGLAAPETPGARILMETFTPMARMMATRQVPPESVSPTGTASKSAGPAGFSAALIPFLWRAGEADAAIEQQRRVLAGFDRTTGMLGDPPRYYDQNLALFAVGWQEQRFRFAPDGTLRVRWKM